VHRWGILVAGPFVSLGRPRPIPLSTAKTLPSSAATESEAWINLEGYRAPPYQGRGPIARVLWYVVSWLVFESRVCPSSGFKTFLLRMFGARLGRGVVVKPRVKIKFPWRLTAGEFVWIGEEVWIDNLADVTIGSHVCLSQGVYLCTGSHDHRSPGFELVTRPIAIGSGAWIAARAVMLPGCRVGANSIVAAGSVVSGEVEEGIVVAGNPAQKVRDRERPEGISPR
jgi:putative colanic acid biosynthesis acetyltransferase WcaF